MNSLKPVTIIGGGLAGLTLGIGLRQRGVPTTVWEAGRYPRHRVCGEFISGPGQATLARLGLLSGLPAAGVGVAKTIAIYGPQTIIPCRPLLQSALSISRYTLDHWLAQEFQRLGGQLRVGERWTGTYAPGIVRANGRRPEPTTQGWRWFGLKVHAQNIVMNADLELHLVPAGYVGLCRLANGDVNICGLFRTAEAVPNLAHRWEQWLSGPPDSQLQARLASAHWLPNSFCTVAGLGLQARRAVDLSELCIGDALTMTPPVTGNGMSMAFESAELALDPLTKYSRGEMTWVLAQLTLARACDRQFESRLRWAAWLQWALFQPTTRRVLLLLASRTDWLQRTLFSRTR